MAIGLPLFHRETGVQEQGALLRPRNKTSAGLGVDGPSLAQIALAFFEDIAQ